MMELLRRYPMACAFALLALVLVAVLAAEYGAGARLGERVSARGAPAAAPVQAKLLPSIAAVNPDQEYSETGARPLFTPTRRPAPPAVAPAAPTAMNKGQFTLTGVTIVGPLKIALLREKSSGRVVRVEEGKEVNGITVAQVDPEQVKLTQGGDSEVVAMLVTKGTGHPVPPPAAAAGPFAPLTGAAPAVPVAGASPVARAAPPPGAQQPGQPQPPAVNPNTLFGPRPGGLAPGNSFQPTTDPTTATPPTSQAAPLTPEELLARRRARRNQQPQ
jgi:general secretion pathway protein N